MRSLRERILSDGSPITPPWSFNRARSSPKAKNHARCRRVLAAALALSSSTAGLSELGDPTELGRSQTSFSQRSLARLDGPVRLATIVPKRSGTRGGEITPKSSRFHNQLGSGL